MLMNIEMKISQILISGMTLKWLCLLVISTLIYYTIQSGNNYIGSEIQYSVIPNEDMAASSWLEVGDVKRKNANRESTSEIFKTNDIPDHLCFNDTDLALLDSCQFQQHSYNRTIDYDVDSLNKVR